MQFPLTLQTGKRYLTDAQARPFLLHGDTAWSIAGQLTDAQIDTYLNNRQAKGFNAILFSAPEAYYTNQSPTYNNADGLAPFAPMTDFTRPNDAYWRRVDRIVDGARARGMACVINPAYLGYFNGSSWIDGWGAAVLSASPAELQIYGTWLANRYTQGNIIWSMGGDHDGATAIARQWNIAIGIRAVRSTDLITAHPLADSSNADDAFTYWGGYSGFNINWIYGYEDNGFYVPALAAQARARPTPFIAAEFRYEQEGTGTNAARLRRQSYAGILSGACGQIFGNNPIWHFESAHAPYPSYSGTWQSNLDSPGSRQQVHVQALFSAFEWWKLEPRPNTSLVTSSLGSGASRLCPALASDRSFAMVYVPQSQDVTINLTALAPSLVRVRLYDPVQGTYGLVGGSPFVNGDPLTISTGGERVIVLDAST